MIDHDDGKNLITLSIELVKTAWDYFATRKAFAEAKIYLDLQVALRGKELRNIRSNIGYDMALITLVELDIKNKPYYEEYVRGQNRYKGLEKVLNAVSSRISLGQSIIKNKIQERV